VRDIDANRLLESAIRITNERDQQSLNKVLVQTLNSILDAEAIILLNPPRSGETGFLLECAAIPEDAAKRHLEYTTSEWGEPRIIPDRETRECLETGQPVVKQEEKFHKMLFPVEMFKGNTGVLAVISREPGQVDQSRTGNFLRIYENYLGIIYDNEHDTLTGLLNRKTFEDRISEILPKSSDNTTGDKERRQDGSTERYWLGVLDIDHFKSINDTYGHLYGDEVLLLFANLMIRTFRQYDLLFRYGGEEFVVVVRSSREKDAIGAFERFRQTVGEHQFPKLKGVTVSIGMVEIHSQDYPMAVVSRADQALYYAKEHGRNRVCSYENLVASGALIEQHAEDDIELF
jgi:diguanylate cyclase (GGDEF)-like protein